MVAIPTTDLPVDAIDFGDMSLWERQDWPGMFATLRANGRSRGTPNQRSPA